MVTSTQSCILLHTRAHTSKHDWSRHACLSKKITTIPHHTHARTPTHTAKAGLEHAHCDCKKTRVGKATHTICEQRRVGARNVCPPQHICSYSHRRPTGGELQCHTHIHTNTHKYRRVSTAVLHAAKTRLVCLVFVWEKPVHHTVIHKMNRSQPQSAESIVVASPIMSRAEMTTRS